MRWMPTTPNPSLFPDALLGMSNEACTMENQSDFTTKIGGWFSCDRIKKRETPSILRKLLLSSMEFCG